MSDLDNLAVLIDDTAQVVIHPDYAVLNPKEIAQAILDAGWAPPKPQKTPRTKETKMSANRSVTFHTARSGRQRFAICQTCGATILTAYKKHWWSQTMTVIEINAQEITSHHYHQHLNDGDLN